MNWILVYYTTKDQYVIEIVFITLNKNIVTEFTVKNKINVMYFFKHFFIIITN